MSDYPSSSYGASGYSGSSSGSSMVRTLLYATVVVLIVVAIYYLLVPRNLNTRLVRAGWELYTSPTCPHCKTQLATLGGSYPALTQCGGAASSGGSGSLSCSQITAYPTWYNYKTTKTVKGMRTVSQLEEMLAGA